MLSYQFWDVQNIRCHVLRDVGDDVTQKVMQITFQGFLVFRDFLSCSDGELSTDMKTQILDRGNS